MDARAVRANRPYESSRGRGRAERAKRLRGVFGVNPGHVDGHHLLLVDDVMTTGATVDAIARACRAAGATRIEVAVLARAPR